MTEDLNAAEILKIGTPNKNGHVYPEEAVDAMIEQFNKRAETGQVLGELGMGQGGTIHLENVSHIVSNLRKQGDTVVATIKVLKTPSGQILESLLGKAPMDFRTRGFADIDAHGVISNYQLVSIDAVSDGA